MSVSQSQLRSAAALMVCMLSTAVRSFADKTVYSSGQWSISAPDSIGCTEPPKLTLRGPQSLLDDRAALADAAAGIRKALLEQCPELREVVLVAGRRSRLVSLPGANPGSAISPTARPPVPESSAADSSSASSRNNNETSVSQPAVGPTGRPAKQPDAETARMATDTPPNQEPSTQRPEAAARPAATPAAPAAESRQTIAAAAPGRRRGSERTEELSPRAREIRQQNENCKTASLKFWQDVQSEDACSVDDARIQQLLLRRAEEFHRICGGDPVPPAKVRETFAPDAARLKLLSQHNCAVKKGIVKPLPPFNKALMAMRDSRRLDPCSFDINADNSAVLHHPLFAEYNVPERYDDEFLKMFEALRNFRSRPATAEQYNCLLAQIKAQLSGKPFDLTDAQAMPAPPPPPRPAKVKGRR